MRCKSCTEAPPKSLKNKRSAKVRSALSNGSALFPGVVDGRSETGRRYADLVADLIAERGGREILSVGQMEAVRTYAGLAILRDRMARQARQMGPPKPPERKSLRQHLAGRAGARTASAPCGRP